MKKTLLSTLVASAFLLGCNDAKNADSTSTAFTDSGTVHGNASVNTFFGEYTLKGDSLFFDQMAATSMMGHDMELEMAIMSALAQCATVEAQDSTVTVKDHGGNTVMTLKRR